MLIKGQGGWSVLPKDTKTVNTSLSWNSIIFIYHLFTHYVFTVANRKVKTYLAWDLRKVQTMVCHIVTWINLETYLYGDICCLLPTCPCGEGFANVSSTPSWAPLTVLLQHRLCRKHFDSGRLPPLLRNPFWYRFVLDMLSRALYSCRTGLSLGLLNGARLTASWVEIKILGK